MFLIDVLLIETLNLISYLKKNPFEILLSMYIIHYTEA